MDATHDSVTPPKDLTDAGSSLPADVIAVLTAKLPRYYWPERDDPVKKEVTRTLRALTDLQRRGVLARVLTGLLNSDATARRADAGLAMKAELIVGSLRRRKLDWTVEQLIWLSHLLAQRSRYLHRLLGPTATILVDGLERLPESIPTVQGDLLGLIDVLDRLSRSHDGWDYGGVDFAALAGRLIRLTESGGDPTGIPDQVLDDRDSFGARGRHALLAAVDPATAAAWLQTASTYPSATRPTARWRSQAAEAVTRNPALVLAARALAAAVIGQPDPVNEETVWIESWIDPAPERLIRASLWLVSDHDEASTVLTLLRDVAAYCAQSARTYSLGVRSLRITNTAVAALVARSSTRNGRNPVDGAATVTALTAIRRLAANRAITMTIDKAMDEVAAARGVDVASLIEMSVPSFGLDADGRLSRRVGAYTAQLQVHLDGGRASVETHWANPAGRALAGTPAAVRTGHADVLTELKGLDRDIRATVPAQRDRLDHLLATHRSWDPAAWRQHYLDHPVVGLVARQLIWTVRAPLDAVDSWSGWPTRVDGEWHLRAEDGQVRTVPQDSRLALWHPLNRPLDEILRWREIVTSRQVVQPFKQAFREIYLLTDAERATGTHSNRFAAHILRYRQMSALMRARDWRPPQLGDWDMGDEGEGSTWFGDVRAGFALVHVDEGGASAELCASDRVVFERASPATGAAPIPLDEVDPLIFSEAMRDIDLFVGVTSIASDPEWTSEGSTRHRRYWQDTSFGPLTESAVTRREVLTAIVPHTSLASTATVEDRFLRVRGKLRTYKIHLGSANILMEPDDQYLCIVPRQSGPTQLYLPFEGDGRLSLILSKAFLLAEDDTITDSSITSQIALRR